MVAVPGARGGDGNMISVLVKGYGLVVWHDAKHWRAYGRSDAMTATLSARVGMALGETPDETHDAVRDQLLRIRGAVLLADEVSEEPTEEPPSLFDDRDFPEPGEPGA